MQFILLGPPGAGKGKQAQLLSDRLAIPHISTGDMLRSEMAAGTLLGRQASEYVESGELVPDDLIMQLVRAWFERSEVASGWILDGFPRSVAQEQALDELLTELGQPRPKVIYFDVRAGLLIDRLMSMKRPDDTVAAIRRRIAVYEQETAPLVEHYQMQLRLTTVNGNLSIAEVATALAHLGKEETGAATFIPNEAAFNRHLERAPLLVVDCTAAWCGPCKLVAPLIDQLAEEFSDAAGNALAQQVEVFKLDLDANKAVASRFGIRSIPAVMFFKGGELLETVVGVKPYATFKDTVSRLM